MEKKRVYVVACTLWSSNSGDNVGFRVFEDKQKAREVIAKNFKEYKRDCIEDGFDKDYFVETNKADFKSFSPDEWEKHGVTFEIKETVLE